MANDLANDGTFTFGGGFNYTYDPNNRAVAGKIDFIGVAMHELSEIMGRIALMGANLTGNPDYMLMDLFHYTGAGVRGLHNGANRSFSINNGTTLLKAFNNAAMNGGDLQDWASGTVDCFNAFFSIANVQYDLTAVDLRNMDAIGYSFGAGGGTGASLHECLRELRWGDCVHGPRGLAGDKPDRYWRTVCHQHSRSR